MAANTNLYTVVYNPEEKTFLPVLPDPEQYPFDTIIKVLPDGSLWIIKHWHDKPDGRKVWRSI